MHAGPGVGWRKRWQGRADFSMPVVVSPPRRRLLGRRPSSTNPAKSSDDRERAATANSSSATFDGPCRGDAVRAGDRRAHRARAISGPAEHGGDRTALTADARSPTISAVRALSQETVELMD